MRTRTTLSKLNCLIITLGYFSIGGIWILFSNTLFTLLSNRQPVVPQFIEMSHWLFLGLSSSLLYFLLQHWDSLQPKSDQPLQKLNVEMKNFRDYSAAAVKAGDGLALMQEACQLCVEAGGHRMAWIASAEQDKNKTLKQTTNYGNVGCFFDNFDATWENNDKGRCPAGTSIRIGESIIYQDLLNNSRFKHRREAAKRCGFGSCISIPLRDEFNITGALIIFNAKTYAFDSEQVKLLEEIAGYISTGITNIRKDKEHTLAGNEHLMLAAITEQTAEGIITFNTDGIIQYVNPSFIELCQLPLNKIIGISIHEFQCSKNNPKFYQAILAAIKANRPKAGHFITRNGNGDEHDIDVKIAPVFDASNRVIQYITTIRNSTKEMQLQRYLQQTQKLEALAALSGAIIHAFKKQLVTISTNSQEGLSASNDNASFQEKFLSIFKATQNGHKLVEQFTAINQQNEPPKQLIDIADIINKCVVALRTNLPSTIKINKHIGSDLGMIKANNKQIHQLIMNLSTNALDAMIPTGGVLEISLFNLDSSNGNCQSQEGFPKKFLKLTITDTGQGMDRNELNYIFDPFYTTKGQGEWQGLGLSIAHGIVKNHGGKISANSILGAGTSFVILLPQEETVETCEAKSEARGQMALA